MSKRNFELFMYCLGNGITVCNKAVMEHNDYKQIAHISANGHTDEQIGRWLSFQVILRSA